MIVFDDHKKDENEKSVEKQKLKIGRHKAEFTV
jgi:hypothetical protein